MQKRTFTKILTLLLLLAFLIQPGFAATHVKHKSKSHQTSKHTTTHKKKVYAKKSSPTKKKIAAKSHLRKKKIAAKKTLKTSRHAAAKKSSRHAAKKNQKIAKKTVTRSPQKTTALASKKPVKENIGHATTPSYLFSSIEKSLISFVHYTVSSIRYTAYKLGGTKIDESRGIYVVDCSAYVDHVMKTVYPEAYTSLTTWSGSEKPTSDDYYHYFTSSEHSKHWNTIEDVESLRPGDIIVFRYKTRLGNETGGHVMVVMDKPVRNGDTFMVRIADSAPTGHSKDTRVPHTSGVGIGTILLKVNQNTFQPYAYAWKVGSRFEYNVNVAMARPINVG